MTRIGLVAIILMALACNVHAVEPYPTASGWVVVNVIWRVPDTTYVGYTHVETSKMVVSPAGTLEEVDLLTYTDAINAVQFLISLVLFWDGYEWLSYDRLKEIGLIYDGRIVTGIVSPYRHTTAHFKVYPNPFEERITIEGNGMFRLYDIKGRLVYETEVNKKKVVLLNVASQGYLYRGGKIICVR